MRFKICFISRFALPDSQQVHLSIHFPREILKFKYVSPYRPNDLIDVPCSTSSFRFHAQGEFPTEKNLNQEDIQPSVTTITTETAAPIFDTNIPEATGRFINGLSNTETENCARATGKLRAPD